MRDNLNLRQQRLDELSFRMESAWRSQLLAAAQRLQHLTSSVLRYDVSHRILLVRERLDALTSAAAAGVQQHWQTAAVPRS